MRFTERDDFINKVLGRVRFKYDHEAIRQELEEHIDDLTEELKDGGLESGDALTSAILYMGDPEEIGREMDKAHSPALGTVWLILKYAAAVMIVLTVISAAAEIFGLVQNLSQKYQVSDDRYGSAVYTVDVGERFKLDDRNIVIDELVYYETNVLEVRYYMWYDIFSDSIDWTFTLGADCFSDGEGNEYYSLGGGGGGGPISYYQNYIDDFPADADRFIIDYERNGRTIYCDIDLSRAEYAAEEGGTENGSD